MEEFRDRILFPMEQPAVLNTLANKITGRKVTSDGVSIHHLLDEDIVDKIVDSYWSRAWSKFTLFGNAMAGLIG